MMPIDAYLFMSLLTAHLIGDFVLQTRNDVLYKARLPVLIKHASTIAVLSWVFTGSLGLWFILPWIGITHGATDYVKAKYGDMIGNPFNTFLIDQFVHFLVIVVTAVAVPVMLTYESAWMIMFDGIYMQAMYITSGVVIAVRVGGIVIGIWISPMTELLEPVVRERMERSGKVIGELERLLIFFFVFIGLYNLIGFLIAAKAVFRVGTLIRDERRSESEYIIVGTLISFTWALIFAWLTQYLLLYPGW